MESSERLSLRPAIAADSTIYAQDGEALRTGVIFFARPEFGGFVALNSDRTVRWWLDNTFASYATIAPDGTIYYLGISAL